MFAVAAGVLSSGRGSREEREAESFWAERDVLEEAAAGGGVVGSSEASTG